VHAGDNVWIGPDSNGNFTATNVRSIQRKRLDVPAASAGQSASFALRKIRRKDVRKGMVVLPKVEGQPAPKVCREFIAEVLILSHATTIKTKYQASKSRMLYFPLLIHLLARMALFSRVMLLGHPHVLCQTRTLCDYAAMIYERHFYKLASRCVLSQ
jgi:hypothetical protein